MFLSWGEEHDLRSVKMDDSITNGPEHQWASRSSPPNSRWQERHCPVCGLWDRRHTERKVGSNGHGWQVTLSCIEPVPARVEYHELFLELFDHGIELKPICIGVPGEWTIGFDLGESVMSPKIKVFAPETLEHGFAALTRWIRVRRYDIRCYSDISQRLSRIDPSVDRIDETGSYPDPQA